MKKNSVLVTSLSMIKFEDYTGRFEKLKNNIKNKEIKKYFEKIGYERLYKKLKNHQQDEVCQTSVVNWFWSKSYFIDLSSSIGYKCEDISYLAQIVDKNYDLYKLFMVKNF